MIMEENKSMSSVNITTIMIITVLSSWYLQYFMLWNLFCTSINGIKI
uniref:Uncharacterized protein n=1 Tax=Arundo donax TaxID=35708 RepID=A0A0A9FUW0_ARUDO